VDDGTAVAEGRRMLGRGRSRKIGMGGSEHSRVVGRRRE